MQYAIYLWISAGIALITYFMWRGGSRGDGKSDGDSQPPGTAYVVLGSLFASMVVLFLFETNRIGQYGDQIEPYVRGYRHGEESSFAVQRELTNILYRIEFLEAEKLASVPPGPTGVSRPPDTSHTLVPTGLQRPTIKITNPLEGDTVPFRAVVSGTVSDPHTSVWVIVHPLITSGYWVQAKASVKASGEWQTAAFFGGSGSRDQALLFEIRAVVNPRGEMYEGRVLDAWPDEAGLSRVVGVIRE